MTTTITCLNDNPVFAEASSTFFAFASTTCTSVQETGTTTGALYLNGFTYGEIWIGLLLLGMFLMQFFGGIVNQVAGLKGRARNTRNPNIK